jgi:hypothetical protein
LAMATLPVALRLRTMLNSMDDPDLLAPAVPSAAALQFRFGLLLASGILLGAVVRRWRQLKW